MAFLSTVSRRAPAVRYRLNINNIFRRHTFNPCNISIFNCSEQFLGRTGVAFERNSNRDGIDRRFSSKVSTKVYHCSSVCSIGNLSIHIHVILKYNLLNILTYYCINRI